MRNVLYGFILFIYFFFYTYLRRKRKIFQVIMCLWTNYIDPACLLNTLSSFWLLLISRRLFFLPSSLDSVCGVRNRIALLSSCCNGLWLVISSSWGLVRLQSIGYLYSFFAGVEPVGLSVERLVFFTNLSSSCIMCDPALAYSSTPRPSREIPSS